ncbi:hypothetical protein, partial [Erwinia amylovora]|uniref:hypothetical protein n=2 Tax=Erwinia amylovora TaxID=552 RepID=UPI0019644433
RYKYYTKFFLKRINFCWWMVKIARSLKETSHFLNFTKTDGKTDDFKRHAVNFAGDLRRAKSSEASESGLCDSKKKAPPGRL